jgi:hypothetical protein
VALRYIFADEAGDFEFARKPNVSRYFIVCTVCLDACHVGAKLLELRRELAWQGYPLGDYFHASEDKQAVRDTVFKLICAEDFELHATIMEKSKAQKQVRVTRERFYQYGWFYHFKHVAPKIVAGDTELLITTASVGTRKGQAVFTAAVNDVVQQTIQRNQWQTYFCRSAADPCLQIADYCTWAIQKKWERDDSRAYDMIKGRITYEYDLWAHGNKHYY